MESSAWLEWAKLAHLQSICNIYNCPVSLSTHTVSWKSKMNNVVKYDVYLDILLVGSIYVIKICLSRKTQNPRHPANPVIQAQAQAQVCCTSMEELLPS